LLNVNKPGGMTSRRVVDRVERLVRPAKAGHAGTLDPLATGVLIVCVGAATRLIPLIQEQRKQYRARFQLGCRSNTDDVTGDVTAVDVAVPVSRDNLESALAQFVGRIEQVPPQYSAVHVSGERAYDLARQGRTVEIKPKLVEVYQLHILSFAYPNLELEIECGSGTYIRSIGRDLGAMLRCGAVLSELIRTRIGPFTLEQACDVESIDAATLKDVLLPAAAAVAHLPQYVANLEELEFIRHGRAFHCRSSAEHADQSRVAVTSAAGDLACLAQFCQADAMLVPKQVFLSQG
jgi:tRNA pseudouridine55 synthase